jgi:hypothetical protein
MHDSNTQPIEHYHTIVPGSPEPKRRSSRRLVTVGVALAALIGLGAGVGAAITGNDGASTSAPTVTGTFTLYDSAMYQCVPSPGYDDIHNGTQVQVEDSTGKVLGIGELDQGVSTGAGSCTWNFTVPDVPMHGSIFKIEVSHRGAIAYSKQDLLNGDVHLTVGSLAE